MDFSNLSTKHLVDMYGHCRVEMSGYRSKLQRIEAELVQRPDSQDTCFDPHVCSKLKIHPESRIKPGTLKSYRPHSKKSTHSNIISFLQSYTEQLKQTDWTPGAIDNLGAGISNYLWQKRVFNTKPKIVLRRK